MSERLIIRLPKQPESVLTLNGEPLVIGSDATSNIVVNDAGVMAQHAYLVKVADRWRVMSYDPTGELDFASQLTTALQLQNGSRFAIGPAKFEFASDPAPPDKRAEENQEPVLEDPEGAVAQLHQAMERIKAEMARVVIGQTDVVGQILVALFGRGHCLLVGTPGLAKTLMARTLAGSLELECKRIQFTPDLMPADITGTQVLEQDPETAERNFRFKHGPIFTNLLLADEINRTPPKTQAALLEAMQERRVTISGQGYDLPQPFFVIASQNPIEQEGTYPLPEAQLDRFMFCVKVDYPNAEDEERIIMETTQDASQDVDPVLSAAMLLSFQHLVRKTPVSRHVGAYATRLVRATRPDMPDAPDFIKNWVRWGAGPRAGQYLLLAAKSHALLRGRLNVSCDDVRAYALPVLRHRVLCNFAAASEGVDSDEIVRRLLTTVPEPDYAKGH
ncbi:MAG: AAA family ATPase [Methylacidiphilales bacterium]|nr:AAA family ATPase [Candidatus Methylacidiphilales bacterium]